MIGESNGGACFEMGMGWRVVVDLGFSVDAWEWNFRRRESLSVCLDSGIEREREGDERDLVCIHDELAK